MADSGSFAALTGALPALRTMGVVPAVAGPLRASIDAQLARTEVLIVQEVAAYADSADPEVLPELRDHLASHLAEICHLLAGKPAGGFEFVRSHAEWRAARKFPLDAILQAYRCLHRSMSTWLRDAALQTAHKDAHVPRVVAGVADFAIEYAGAVGSLVTASYVDHTRRLAEAEGDRRSALFNTLVDGYDESDRRAAALLRRSGYLAQRQSYCVAVARSVNPGEMALLQAMQATPVRTIAGVRDGQVIVVMSATRRLSGWTAPQSRLAERVYPHLRMVGPAALIGLSNDVPSTSHIPRAVSEARLALEHASVARRVQRYSRIPFAQMLVSIAHDDIRSALPGWLDTFIATDSRGRIEETLRAYADCDMNVQRTAKQLGIHPNTIYARMQKVEDSIGLSPLKYRDLTEMLLALDCRGQRRESRA